jgi:hypothetical protein
MKQGLWQTVDTMAMPLTRNSARAAFDEAMASALSPAGLERYRLDRLMELRAVIDSLRAERGQDLLREACVEHDRYCHS